MFRKDSVFRNAAAIGKLVAVAPPPTEASAAGWNGGTVINVLPHSEHA